MTEIPIMIFAAGFGSRMGDLTASTPKPLLRVGNTTLLDHALSIAEHPSLGRQVINVHYKAEMIVDHVSTREIFISDERGTLLETGGGLKKARPLLERETVATLNADVLWLGSNPFDTLLDVWDPKKMDALMLLSSTSQAHSHSGSGDFSMNPDGRLKRGGGLVYTGAQIIKTGTLDAVSDAAFSLNQIWTILESKDRLFGVVYDDDWCDVGTPAGLTEAERLIGRHV